MSRSPPRQMFWLMMRSFTRRLSIGHRRRELAWCWTASGLPGGGSCRHRAGGERVEIHLEVQADVVAADLEMPVGLDGVGEDGRAVDTVDAGATFGGGRGQRRRDPVGGGLVWCVFVLFGLVVGVFVLFLL